MFYGEHVPLSRMLSRQWATLRGEPQGRREAREAAGSARTQSLSPKGSPTCKAKAKAKGSKAHGKLNLPKHLQWVKEWLASVGHCIVRLELDLGERTLVRGYPYSSTRWGADPYVRLPALKPLGRGGANPRRR